MRFSTLADRFEGFWSDRIKRLIDERPDQGTPVHLSAPHFFVERAIACRDHLSALSVPVSIAYASKANDYPWIIEAADRLGLLFDTASIFEYRNLISLGVSADRVLLTGLNKETAALSEANRNGVHAITVDSHDDVVKLETVGWRHPILLRLDLPGRRRRGDVSISTLGNKFGARVRRSSRRGDTSGSYDFAEDILGTLLGHPTLRDRFAGIHGHMGTQILGSDAYREWLTRLARWSRTARKRLPAASPLTIDVGGGLPAEYGWSSVATETLDTLREFLESAAQDGLADRFLVEPGRSLAAATQCTLFRVVEMKRYPDGNVAIVDGGYNVLPNTALMQQAYPGLLFRPGTETFFTPATSPPIAWFGPLCDSLDRFDLVFPETGFPVETAVPGDYLVVLQTGAYTEVLENQFNGYPPADVIRLDDEEPPCR